MLTSRSVIGWLPLFFPDSDSMHRSKSVPGPSLPKLTDNREGAVVFFAVFPVRLFSLFDAPIFGRAYLAKLGVPHGRGAF
jgi:hypothetical protein